MNTEQDLNKIIIAHYEYEHNDGDQIWSDRTIYYQKNDGTYEKEYIEGYNGESYISSITLEEIVSNMKEIKHKVEEGQKAIKIYGSSDPRARGGYSIIKDIGSNIE